ncbi:MAG TPA: transferrin receptor-like dimerization domain-containing protein, partial [Pyrinomonadaceae bacterium]|nr:transferrin receptor-like dimerization domain-containing protein [Pyrinomonadaceae bacterium]
DAKLLGFSAENSKKQIALETKFDASLKAENLREWMKRLSARPHFVGSQTGKENADFMVALFKSWGFDAKTERFDVLFPTPKTRVLEMVSPERFTAKLNEPALKEDATSSQQKEQLPTYNAYSGDGDVTGDVVYANYGVPADYEELEKRGIDVKGKIVLTRYGGAWRGIKPKVAAEHGAIACLIYSDPRDDGYYQGDVYPKGAWRNENGVQRGSVADMPVFPGDPTTPNVGSVSNVKRLDRKDAPTIMKIPVMPISYGDALPILRNLGGTTAPANWRGALPITYKIGGVNNLKVHFKLEFNWDIKPIYNVIAKIEGSEFPDQWIIRGNHHDAWVNGAEDPISGLVTELEEARGIGELLKTGWKPKRTIIYCAWDGEEPGLLGSTEWVETHGDELSKKAVVYINTDSNGRGFLGMGGSHTLEKFINEVAKSVPDPQVKMNVWERARAAQLVAGSNASRREAKNRTDLKIGALGSGSDFTPFLQHLGVASLNLGFGGEDGGGSYHSIYDSFDHYTRFGDTDFAYSVALSKVCGHSVLRFANADVLPFEFTNFASTVNEYANEVINLTNSMRDETEAMNELITSGMLQAVQNPKQKYIAPKKEMPVPELSFKPLQTAVAHLRESGEKYQSLIAKKNPSTAVQRDLNAVLYKTERALTNEKGLPKREWFKHQIYAPGFYTGYGVKTLPAIRESIEQRDWNEAAKQIRLVSETIENFANEIDKAIAIANK